MKRLLIIFILSFCMLRTFGQNKMIIDNRYNGNTHYGNYSKHIDSISELPAVIQFNLDGYLNKVLGSISDSLTFSHGQIIDVEKYFETDSVTFNRGWVMPKYDLNFLLQDMTLGIKNYYLQITMDKYGQILKSEWPNEHYNKRSDFKNNSEIHECAINHAKIRGFDTTDYKVEFKYNKKFDKLCWVFNFVIVDKEDWKEYNTIEIPWNYIQIIDEYISTTSSSH